MAHDVEHKPNVLLLETIAAPADELLRASCNVIFADTPASGAHHVRGQSVQAIVTRGKGQVNPALIDACSGLQVISRCGVGLDNVDVTYATSRGIRVVNAPGTNAATVAEHAIALMLMLVRKMARATNEVKTGNWAYRAAYDGDDIRGKQLGILGFGNIGRRVANLAAAFGMEVQYWDVQPIDSPYEQVSLEEIIANSQIISIHLPLLDSTRGLLSLDLLERAAQKPIIINTARGGLMKDDDVLTALKRGWISGFGADVLEIGTPPAGYELLKLENVLITPHSASLTKTTYDEMCLITVQNTIALLGGKEVEEKYVFNHRELA